MFTLHLDRQTIAVPTRDGAVDDHFGHCACYTLFTVAGGRIAARETHPSPEGCGCKSNIAAELRAKGVGVMLAGNMGDGAKRVLESNGIAVLRGCRGAVEQVVADYLAGRLADSGEGCRAHTCADHAPKEA